MSARRSTSARAGVRLLTIAVGLALSGTGRAYELDAENAFALTGTWTAGPTRIVITADGFSRMYSWEESSTGGRWVNLNGLQSGGAIGPPVVVQTAAGNWETHVFFAKVDTSLGHLVRHDSLGGSWTTLNDLPGLPWSVTVSAVAAVSNVYRRGDNISPVNTYVNGTSPLIGLYVVGSDGQVYGASGNGSTWSGFTNLNATCGCYGRASGIAVTYDFTHPALYTSVWVTISPSTSEPGGLYENYGAIGAVNGQRQWIYHSTGTNPNVALTEISQGGPTYNYLPQVPAAVTWYDMNQPFTATYEHTRVNVYDTSGNIMAFYRDYGTGGAGTISRECRPVALWRLARISPITSMRRLSRR